MHPDDEGSLLSTDEVVDAVAAIGDPDRFEVAYTAYALPADGVTIEDFAAETTLSEASVVSRIHALVEGGVLAERMACLVDPAVDGPEYELTEFGRLLLEEGVLALFDAASAIDDAGDL